MKRLLEPFRETPRRFMRAIVWPIIKAGLTIYSIQIIQEIVDILQTNTHGDIGKQFMLLIATSVCYIVILLVTKNRGYSEIRPKTGNDLFKKYMKKYVRLDHNAVESLGTGRVIAIVEKGIWAWVDVVAQIFIKFGGRLVTIIFALVYVFSINFYYGLAFTVLVSLSIAIHAGTLKYANRYRRKRKVLYIDIVREFVKVIMSKVEILQSNKLSKTEKFFDSNFKVWLPLNYKIETMRFIGEGSTRLIIDFLRAMVIGFVVWGRRGQLLTVGELVALIAIFSMLYDITHTISRFLIETSREFIHVEKMRDMFDTIDPIVGYDEGDDFVMRNGTVEIQSVSLSYNQGDDIFSDFSLRIPGGSKTALVGPSGGGKTTLVKLVAGYLRPNKGSIIVDEQDLRHIALKSYYKHVGYLTQEPSIFDGTIRENLELGMTDIKDDDSDAVLRREHMLQEAIKNAKCEFIYDFPHGVETEIGERGIRLSGGQRQRLAIAKIFIKNPNIIILDEPTSALDSESEEAITQAMNTLFEGRTVIIIAHRLQTVKHADNIILIDNGKIIEQGTHHDLLKQKGKYWKMVELQSGF